MNQTSKTFNILAINPGSTSTKVAFFKNATEITKKSISHTAEELKPFPKIADQLDFRSKLLAEFIDKELHDKIDAIACRGGLLKPIQGGVYAVNETMLKDIKHATYGEHASNLGALLGDSLSKKYGCPAYIADPVVVDELQPLARFSGFKAIERKSIFHALNQKSVARRVAKAMGKEYNECSFIIAHLGGGISVGAHCNGKVIDVNNALNGDGPFSPERAGGVPVYQIMEYVRAHMNEFDSVKKHLVGKGGLVDYLGTNEVSVAIKKAEEGDEYSRLILDAMSYQISKEIAMHGATLFGKVDRIILTGGIAYNPYIVESIVQRVSYLAQIEVIPGEREMSSLAENILLVLENKIEVQQYV